MMDAISIGYKTAFIAKIRKDTHVIRLSFHEGKSAKWNRRRKAQRMKRLDGIAISFKRAVEAGL